MINSNNIPKIALLLFLTTACAVAHKHATREIEEVGKTTVMKGTAYVAVLDYIGDDHLEHSRTIIELVDEEKMAKGELDVLVVHPGASLSWASGETPFTTGDVVELLVDTDLHDEELHVAREVLSVKAKKQATNPPSGLKRTLFVVVNYADASSPCDANCVNERMYDRTASGNLGNAHDMMVEASYGALSFTRNDVITLNYDVAMGDDFGYTSYLLAYKYNDDAGINSNDYDLIQYHTPALSGIGVGYYDWYISLLNTLAADTIAHEFGHNFYFRHSGLDEGDDMEIPSDSGSIYGDYSATMGFQIGSSGQLRGYSLLTRMYAGWLSTTDVAQQDASSCTTRTIASLYTDPSTTSLPSGIAVGRGDGTDYWISYRSSEGYDGKMSSSWRNRVFVHNEGTYSGQSVPAKAFVKRLLVGESWNSLVSDMSISVISIGSSSAQVTVCGPQSSVSQTPTPTPTPTPATPTATPTPTPATPTPTPATPTATPTPTPTATPATPTPTPTPTVTPPTPTATPTPTVTPPTPTATPTPTPTAVGNVCTRDAGGSASYAYDNCLPIPSANGCWKFDCTAWDNLDWTLDCTPNDTRWTKKKCDVRCNFGSCNNRRCTCVSV